MDQNEKLEELKKLGIWFQKYCHKKNCKNYASCPKACSFRCRIKLDLDTAIAWRMARICQTIYTYKEHSSFSLYKNYVYECLGNIDYHKKKYKLLIEKIEEFCKILMSLNF